MLRTLLSFVYCVYVYFFYELLVKSAFAEYSYVALLVVPLVLLALWLLPKQERKPAAVYTFMFIFMDQAIENIFNMDRTPFILSVIFIGMFLYPLGRWYARIKLPWVAAALICALGFNLLFPDKIVQALPHFYLKWKSSENYIGDLTGYLPFVAKDYDHDGKDDIITLGNRDLYPNGKRKDKLDYHIENEKLFPYVWTWKDGKMKRIPKNQIDNDEIRQLLPEEYIGFPYYFLNDKLELEPLVQRQPLSEKMMHFGTAPYNALLLNMDNILRQLDKTDGQMDHLDQSGDFTNLSIKNGKLSGVYKDEAFEVNTSATKIVGSINLGGGKQGLLTMGLEMELLQMIDGQMATTHTITRDMHEGFSQSKFILSDVDHDGEDELIIAYPYTKILKPMDDGTWKMLWSTDDTTFRIHDIGRFTPDGKLEMISLSKSVVPSNDTTYLTSYSYTSQGLKQNWKVMIGNLANSQLADLDGDGTKELITSIYNKNKIYVFAKHHVPVTGILIGLTVLLFAVLAGRRISHAKKQAAH